MNKILLSLMKMKINQNFLQLVIHRFKYEAIISKAIKNRITFKVHVKKLIDNQTLRIIHY